MPKFTFQAKVYKVLKIKVEASNQHLAQQEAEKKAEKYVDENDFRSWTPDKIWIHGHPDDYPMFVPWTSKRV